MHQEFEPPEVLRDTIKCFWYDNRHFGDREATFQVEPDGYAEIIFYFGNLHYISENGGLQPLPSPFLMGLLNRPAVFQTKGRLEVIGVRCFPWTVFDLLSLLPSGKNGVHVFAHPIAELQATLSPLMASGQVNEVIAALEKYFLTTRSQIAVDSMLARAGAAMRQANGAIPVSDVATAAHATVRTLERKFKRSSGFTVKDVSGLIRFEQVRNHLWHYPGANLAGLAHELGYADQAHLSREFKRYSGTTPAAFARNAKKRKQAVSNDFVAFVQA
ncbi:AraC-like DNA-binding protein [Dyadobacter sp. BE34]|uniref:AraC-like DNA-binding protein n=1 Tax=Dyadobacter fermentans TaxID=94254 RepID=A0ABU1QR31_9BACT|nr:MULTISPECIES: helix-turn-helix domain-containing protein [Dyadobacter]MDR6803557.1 AraC-like DNA-binding protein [Dyadobacter fermentans]MDR7041297.1 AraC-like DNA-binding protein [Dyadobacter sp. BE242]MDR7195701.1 AraC-like DNA-binding protein [Dyadobacter sp. BE34]MDR7213755.1 AraC-like DNA-binding protein [Dyadobacter sp. BE31]MDR7261107.1 AraC-like DNA-binding protein [Dyadobacter sp. BE32]